MTAGLTPPTTVRLRGRRQVRDARDGGFTLVEVVVAMACVGIVMAALVSFFVSTGRATNLSSAQQNAAELATEGIEQTRSTPDADLRLAVANSNGRWIPPHPAGTEDPEQPVRNGVRFTRSWSVTTCWQPPAGGGCAAQAAGYLPFLRVLVALAWPDGRCPQAQCSFTTSVLFSNAARNPVFS